jgi:hypothetical protein
MAKKKKTHSKTSNLFWRIAISAVGLALIVLAAVNISLFFWGESTSAKVTTRRFGGSDPGRSSGHRYKWSVDYTFTDKQGVVHSGHTQRQGSDFSVKAGDKVYYFPFAPFISCLEEEAKPNWAQPVYVGLGVFLLWVMNGKKKQKKTRHKAVRRPDGQLDVPDLDDYDDSVEEVFHDNH